MTPPARLVSGPRHLPTLAAHLPLDGSARELQLVPFIHMLMPSLNAPILQPHRLALLPIPAAPIPSFESVTALFCTTFLRRRQRSTLRCPTASPSHPSLRVASPLPVPFSLPAHVFLDGSLHHSLLSLSQLCNSGCEVHLTATDLTVTYIDNVILSGSKEPDALLWTVQFPAPQESTPVLAPVFPIPAPFGDINSVIRSQSDADYVRLIHATLGSPPISSFLRALDRGYLDTIPRLNARMVRRNEPHSPATAYGFLDQTRQGQRSTRPTSSPPSPPVSPPPTPDEDELLDQDTLACLVIKLIPSADLLHVDATGRFPHTSRRGTSSILLFIWDNYVHIEPLCDRSAASYVKAYTSLYKSRDLILVVAIYTFVFNTHN